MNQELQVDVRYNAARIDHDLAAALSSWRNSLFCISKTRPLLYLAAQNHILVYERKPRSLDPVFAGSAGTGHGLRDTKTERTLHCLKDIVNPTPPEVIRRPYGARPGPFDTSDINALVTSFLGTQEVLISVDGLGRIIIRFLDDLEMRPLILNVGSSTWGITIHDRVLAASANSHEVYMFNLGQQIGESSTRPTNDKLRLVGALSNIPNISISSDGNWVASVDVRASVNIWQVHDCDYNRTEVIQSRFHIPGHDDWDMAWACLWIPESSFRETSCRQSTSKHEAVCNPNAVRSWCPNLPWWIAVGANVSTELDDRPLSIRERMLTIRYATSGRKVNSDFERHWRTNTIDLFEKFEEYNSNDLLLITLVDQIVLLHSSDFTQTHAICFYPFGARYSTSYAFERINFVKPCFQLGLIVVATQRGNASVFELIKCAERDNEKQVTRYSYSLRCASLLSDEEVKDDGELLGIDIVQLTTRSATAMLLFRSGRIVSMDIERSDEWTSETEWLML